MGQPAPVLDLDLSCKEIQTAQDILFIEDSNSLPSPSPAPKSRNAMRRSLRGQLLESRLSVHERINIMKQSEKSFNNADENNKANVNGDEKKELLKSPIKSNKETLSLTKITEHNEEDEGGSESKIIFLLCILYFFNYFLYR